MKTSKVFLDFNKISTQCELRRTLEFTIGRATYRVEVFYCYSNPKSPWVAQAYSEKRSNWKSVPDFPWVSEKKRRGRNSRCLKFPPRPSLIPVEIRLTHYSTPGRCPLSEYPLRFILQVRCGGLRHRTRGCHF